MSSTVLTAPQSLKDNIKYRMDIRKWALQSEANRRWLIDKCSEDFFFWLETFCWIYEPRPEKDRPKQIPFIPWEHQREPIQKVVDNLGYRDIGIEKARGEGASWMCLMIILWRWVFHDMESFGLVSMNEQAADNPEDPNSLGWKLDWQIKMMPKWMVGARSTFGTINDYTRNVSKHTWINNNNGSSITAYACTGDLSSGGRKTAFLMDELSKFPRGPDEDAMAATEPVTNCRLLVSTPKGADGAYYRCMTEPTPESAMVKITLDWTNNPTRNKDMFRIDLEKKRLLDIVSGDEMKGKWVDTFFDENLPILQRRGFDVDVTTKVWSRWYVDRCLRPRMTPKKIAQEYDRDYGGSSSRFFPASTIQMLIDRTRKPLYQGEVICRQGTFSFTKLKNGHLKLWCELQGGSHPPSGEYVLGIDIATGVGGTMSSNSVISIVDRLTGRKVGEFASPNYKPENLADLAIQIAKWFSNEDGGPAYMIWESNGPGGAFRNRIIESDFRNFHYRTPQKLVNSKRTKEPGWSSSKTTKRDLFSKYRHSLVEGLFENPHELSLRETLNYEEESSGKLVFVSGFSDEDDHANIGENHGDRVVADALANLGMEELNGGTHIPEVKEKRANKINPPQGSFAYRRKQWADKNSRKTVGWSNRG
jgi:hypothetical protein